MKKRYLYPLKTLLENKRTWSQVTFYVFVGVVDHDNINEKS